MDICGIIVPRRDEIVVDERDIPECILSERHDGPHLIKTLEGKYFQWEDDFECGCCKPDEDNRCYSFGEISEKVAQKILKGQE